jgi:hypothetical protein
VVLTREHCHGIVTIQLLAKLLHSLSNSWISCDSIPNCALQHAGASAPTGVPDICMHQHLSWINNEMCLS